MNIPKVTFLKFILKVVTFLLKIGMYKCKLFDKRRENEKRK